MIILDNSDKYIAQDVRQKLHNALEAESFTQVLLEHFVTSVGWLHHYCKKNNISLPDQDKINKIVDEAIKLNDNFHRKFTGDGSIPRGLYRTSGV